jgi:serine phosphatase RsbU (regulator of sigma subunit)
MKLRTRLIVAFVLLSVVPLGAVTSWSYTSNVRALQDATAREADLLAGELTQRMQLVTAQLGQRVEQLMDMPAAPAPVVRASATTPVEPAVTAAAADAASRALSDQVATALGEAAILLNNVELPGTRGSGARATRPPVPGETGSAPPSQNADGLPRLSAANRPSGFRVRPPVTRPGSGSGRGAAAALPAPPPADTPAAPGAPGATTAPAVSVPSPDVTIVTVDPSGRGPAGATYTDRVRIDTSSIWRQMYNHVVPPGQTGAPTADQRQQLAREVSQRVLGIREGLRLSVEELKKKADEARRKADASAAQATHGAARAVQPVVASSPAAPTPPASLTPPTSEGPMTKRSALSGTQLNVTMEQNGQVVRKVNAEINLPNTLMTVFSAIGREQGELPFAVGPDGHIYTQTDEDRAKVQALGAVARPDGPVGTTVLHEWIVVTTVDPSGSGLRFGIARSVGDSLSSLRRTAGRNAGLGLLFIGLAIAGIVPVSSRLTRNLSTLTLGVQRIAHGDYSARVAVKAHDEIGDLARAFNQMAADVESHQRAVVGQERLKRELELGRQIQHDMLPHEPLRLGLTEIQGVSVPAREVGGDFFNYFALPDRHVALLVGDVSGKGVGAALLMANIQASLRTRFALGQDLSAIANAIDIDIEANSPGQMYATLFLGILDSTTRRLRYVNAGHHPQFVLRAAGGLERMPSTGLPVGLLAGRGYSEVEVQLSAADLLFFYTDGCVETENEAGDMFGADRLEKLLESCGTGAPNAVLHYVERAVDTFRGSRERFDDATMMAVRIG